MESAPFPSLGAMLSGCADLRLRIAALPGCRDGTPSSYADRLQAASVTMGKKKKWVETHLPAIKQLYEDVGKNAFKTFRVDALPSGTLRSGLAEKVSSVVVMTSGSSDEARDWMVVVPLRVDVSGSQGTARPPSFVHDKDPMTFYFSTPGSPSVSGSISFHSSYFGRTEDAEPFGTPTTLQEAVADLRAQFSPTSGSFEDADGSLRNALQYGVKAFRKMEAELDERGIPTVDDE